MAVGAAWNLRVRGGVLARVHEGANDATTTSGACVPLRHLRRLAARRTGEGAERGVRLWSRFEHADPAEWLLCAAGALLVRRVHPATGTRLGRGRDVAESALRSLAAGGFLQPEALFLRLNFAARRCRLRRWRRNAAGG
jgi:hypothetical protein